MTGHDDDLLDRALLHELTPDEERTLADRLKAEPALARRLLRFSRDEALLVDAVAEARAGQSTEPPPPPRPGGVWILGPLLIVGLGALFFLLRPKPAPDAVPVAVAPAPPRGDAPDFGSGLGLRAQYFDNEDLTSPRVTRIDPIVDFDWKKSPPHPSLDQQYFSVRWRGQVEPLYSEPYTFHLYSDDGARMWVDGKPLISDWTVRGARELTGTLDLAAGRRYDLTLEYFQCVATASVRLSWSSASQSKQVIPQRQLYPAASDNHLIDETFAEGRLTPGLWEEHLDGARFEPGYLYFPEKAAPWFRSLRAYERKPGLCLAVEYLGNVHRGGAKDENPRVEFVGGPGWTMGQHQGRHKNTAVPLDADNGIRNYPIRNDNIDTLFMVVLRKEGAYYLTSGEPDAAPPRALLRRVTGTGDLKDLRVSVKGGRANARFGSLTLTDLGGVWAEPDGLATLRETAPVDGTLYESGADGQWDVVATPDEKTQAIALVVRAKDADNHYRFELSARGTRFVKRIAGRDEGVDRTTWTGATLQAGKPVRLSVRLEGTTVDLHVDDRPAVHGWELPAIEPMGARVGVIGHAAFRNLVAWPVSVEIPEGLAAKLPPVPLRGDGDVLVHDDFEAPDGTPLDGRMPKVGRHPWKVGQGEWTIRNGAAALKGAPGWARLDAGYSNYEITATIELPKAAPPWPNDWFPAIQARSTGAASIAAAGGINARFLWQGGSNEIEVWDTPPNTPESRARFGGSPRTELLNATNITPMLKPGQTHRLRLVVRGSRVSYFCDDTLVGTANTRVPVGTWVGLNIDEKGDAGARFLDLTVRGFRSR